MSDGGPAPRRSLNPSRRAMLLLSGPVVVSMAALVGLGSLPLILGLDLLVLLILLGDGLLGLPLRRSFRCELDLPGVWSLRRPETVTIRLDHLGRRAIACTLRLDLPRALVPEEDPIHLELPAGVRAETAIVVRALRRGSMAIHGVHLGLRSRLGLWHRQLQVGPSHTVHVHPDLKQLAEYALLARTDRLGLIGVNRQRRGGGDTEFERLRDHQSGDPLQRIDWKATARRDQLTVRDYQISRAQRIVLMLDVGRMLLGRSLDAAGHDAGSLLDRAIDSALMLAWLALHQGDRVGLIAYADGILRYVPAAGGPRQLNRIVHAVHDLEPQLVESRHDLAFLELQRRERKRCLAVLFTHVLDDVNAEMLERHLTVLSGRHLPLAVLLRDRDLHRHLVAAPEDEDTFWRAGAAAEITNWRRQLLRKLEVAGALTIDVDADALTPELVNSYLRVKAQHRL